MAERIGPAGAAASRSQLLHPINDLALLSAVRKPIVVDPDSRLESTALRKGWTVLRLDRPFKATPEAPRIDLRSALPDVPRPDERRARER